MIQILTERFNSQLFQKITSNFENIISFLVLIKIEYIYELFFDCDQLFFYNMQKNQLKPNRDKKKNIETGMLMGQNTNIFSQLSATFLQGKSSNTEEEQQFLKNTQIVEYHDQNINRLIALLRKKAEVTKLKAVAELRQSVSKMEETQLESFMPTFAQLYLEITLNEPSKQILDQFVTIAQEALANHKKIVLRQISTLYAPLLITMRLGKLASLLFTGSEEELQKKSLMLLLKKQSRKKFMVMFKIIAQCDSKQKISQSNFQRNCASVMKIVKQFIKINDKIQKPKQIEQDFLSFLQQVSKTLQHDSIDEYFKAGGKAKAAIIQLYSIFVSLASKHRDWKIEWQHYAKIIGSNFLDKDPLVQQSLWKFCNRQWFQSLIAFEQMAKEEKQDDNANSIIIIYLPKSDQKLLQVLKVGGLSMYKQLPHFCQIFPWTNFLKTDNHKALVNKLNFMRKLLSSLLLQQDQNESRIQCYFKLVELLLERVKQFDLSQFDQKKSKQLKTLCLKFQRETVQNLQQRYYSDPPTSKNSFTYYIPQYVSTIINNFEPQFEFKFNPIHSFLLYKQLNPQKNTVLLDKMFGFCQDNLSLCLKYLQVFPSRQVKVDMSPSNKEVQITAKIFLLTSGQQLGIQNWLHEDWDFKKKIIAFDPRITLKDIDSYQEEELMLKFKPYQNFPSQLYNKPNLDDPRFNYFLSILLSDDSFHYIGYFIPFINDVLLTRNPAYVNNLLQKYQQRVKQLKEGKWSISNHEVVLLRVISQLVVEYFAKSKGYGKANPELSQCFIDNYCQFVRLMSNFKMDSQVQQLLKRIHQLLPIQQFRSRIFISCKISILQTCSNTLQGGQKQQEKIRKNRLAKCLEFVHKLLRYCVVHNNKQGYFQLIQSFIINANNWKQSLSRSQPWILAYAFLQKIEEKGIQAVASFLLNDYQSHQQFINLLLSSDVLLPLQAHPSPKKQFIALKSTLQKGILQFQQQKQSKFIKNIISKLFQSGNVQLAEGLKSLITYLLFEKYENDAQLLSIFRQNCVNYPFQQFIKGGHSINRSLIYIGIISVIPLKRLDNIDQIYSQLIQKLHSCGEGLEYLEMIAICCVFWNKQIGLQEALTNIKGDLQKIVNSSKHHSSTISPSTTNFTTYSFFSFINTMQPNAPKQVFEMYANQIQQEFWRNISQGSQLHGLAQSVRMKYATRSILSSDQLNAKRLIEQVPKIGREEYIFYRQLLAQIEEDQEQELPHHENIINLFIELSEFLLRITPLLNVNILPNQQIILELIQCPFPALKKASFLLLKSMYELKLVQREPPKAYDKLLNYQIQINQQLTSNVCSLISTYFYTWQALLLRRQATQRGSQSQQYINLSLQDYIQSAGYSDLLIKNCFVILEDKLEYLKNEGDYLITCEELQADDYTLMLQEGDTEQKLFKMSIRTLFLYVIHFPVFLRDFMDHNKKYKNICDRLLRQVISEAIFREEVAKIELKEPEWKSAGNFQIYCTIKNKEIYAEYTHDVIRIGLRLVMRGNYPLSPIDIQFGQGLKIEEGSRWGLMLQSQLHNRNNTIINGILLWKDNIDKKLSGVQQCAICFDIVNPSGQLPKKGCKTCKKKFHGNCIMKWFTKSNKSECPLCKSQFL